MTKIEELFTRYPVLAVCENALTETLALMLETYGNGGKIMVCGNGGSCADAQHIVGELMKGFLLRRPMTTEQKQAFETALGEEEAENFASRMQRGIPAMALDGATGLLTAYANDVDADYIYAQQVFACGQKNDLLIGISTSGNSKNIYYALLVANLKGTYTVGLVGQKGGIMKDVCDVTFAVPETETFKVQECHLPLYHLICRAVENEIFGE